MAIIHIVHISFPKLFYLPTLIVLTDRPQWFPEMPNVPLNFHRPQMHDDEYNAHFLLQNWTDSSPDVEIYPPWKLFDF